MTLKLVFVDIFLPMRFYHQKDIGLSHSVGRGCVGPSVSLTIHVCQFTGSHSMCVNTVLFCVGM